MRLVCEVRSFQPGDGPIDLTRNVPAHTVGRFYIHDEHGHQSLFSVSLVLDDQGVSAEIGQADYSREDPEIRTARFPLVAWKVSDPSVTARLGSA